MSRNDSQPMTLQQWLETVAPTIGANGPDYIRRSVARAVNMARTSSDMEDALWTVEFFLSVLRGRGSSFADGAALVHASLELHQPLAWWELEQQEANGTPGGAQ